MLADRHTTHRRSRALLLPLALVATTACDDGLEAGDDTLRDGDDLPVFSPAAVGDPQISAQDPHRLLLGGQSWYAAGYYAGAALNMTGQDYAGNSLAYNTALIDTLADRGVGYMRMWANWGAVSRNANDANDDWDDFLLAPWPRSSKQVAKDGRPKLELSLKALDPAYLSLLRSTIEHAAARGIVVQVILEDCWHMGFGQSSGFGDYDFFDEENNTQGLNVDGLREWSDPNGPAFPYHAFYVSEVVREVGDLPVVWEICNEPRLTGGAAADRLHEGFHAAITSVIRSAEANAGHPSHLVMPIDLPEHRFVGDHDLAINSVTDAETNHDLLVSQFANGQVAIYDNDSFTPLPSLPLLRALIWGVFTAGANVDIFDENLYKASVLSSGAALDRMAAVGHLGSFAARFDLVGMVPLDDDLERGWALGHADEQYLVYLPEQPGLRTLRLPGLVGRGCEVHWYDPRTGVDAGTTSGRCDQPIAAPSQLDWAAEVVVIEGPAVGWVASFVPGPGQARRSVSTFGDFVPAISYYFDESLGHFEQRPGAPCHTGQNNPTHLKMRYEGAQPLDACTFQFTWDAAPISCSSTMLANLNAGVEAVINTDLRVHMPVGPNCPIADTTIHSGFGVPQSVWLDFEIAGETYRREMQFTKQAMP